MATIESPQGWFQANPFFLPLELCPVLGLAQCEYRFQPDPRAPGFLSGAAYFPQDPLVGGPIGEVRNVFGKKAAKEECAKGVLEFLEGVRKERMELAERVIRERDEAMKKQGVGAAA